MVEAPRIVTEIPGPKAKEIIKESQKYLITTTRDFPLVIKRMENDIIEDVDGNIFIDFAAGIAVANVGHRNKEILDAIKKQLDYYIHSAPHDFFDTLQFKLAKRLSEITPGDFPKKVFFGNSGTEANEAALKIAYKARNATRVIAFIGSFHGRTLGSLSLTASKPVHKKGYPSIPGVEHVPYPNPYRCPPKMDPEECGLFFARFIEEYLFNSYVPPEEVAAIIFEPIAGEGGYIVPPKTFFKELNRIAKDYDLLLIDDEVQAGICRTGKWFAIEHFGITPDIITTAKALAGGLPLGAAIARAELDFKESGCHSSTFGGNALSLAAALTNLEIIERENLCERATKLGKVALERLYSIMENSKIIGDIRGVGLMIGVEIVSDKSSKKMAPEIRNKVVLEALRRGLVLLPAGKSAFRISPPLTISEENLEKGLEIIESSIRTVESNM